MEPESGWSAWERWKNYVVLQAKQRMGFSDASVSLEDAVQEVFVSLVELASREDLLDPANEQIVMGHIKRRLIDLARYHTRACRQSTRATHISQLELFDSADHRGSRDPDLPLDLPHVSGQTWADSTLIQCRDRFILDPGLNLNPFDRALAFSMSDFPPSIPLTLKNLRKFVGNPVYGAIEGADFLLKRAGRHAAFWFLPGGRNPTRPPALVDMDLLARVRSTYASIHAMVSC